MNKFLCEWSLRGVDVYLTSEKKSLFKSAEKKSLPIREWVADGNPTILIGLSALYEQLQEIEDDSILSVLLTHQQVAGLTELQAKALNLPTTAPFQLRIWTEGVLRDGSLKIQSEFLDYGTFVYDAKRVGSILTIGHKSYRIPSPLFDLCVIAKEFPDSRDAQVEALSYAAHLIGIESNDVNPSHLLANIKLRHVSAFSCSIGGNLSDPDLDPVLFSKHIIDKLGDGDEVLDEAQALLSVADGLSFSEEFKTNHHVKSTYLLPSGEYVYIDPSIRKAMDGFRKISIAEKEVRQAFTKAPTAVLSDYIDDEDYVGELLDVAFVATAQFSDRVTEINEWEVPELPFLAQEVTNNWGDDVLIFRQLGNFSPVMIPKSILPEVVERLDLALQSGEKKLQIDGIDIPVISALLEEMRNYLPVKPDPKPDPDPDEPPIVIDEKNGPYVGQTIDNFQAINFSKQKVPPVPRLEYRIPRVLLPSTKLLNHQIAGVKWLISAYNQGMPGVLVADDMGLGKTLQALVLLALYQEQNSRGLPTIIIAPTGLLKNWLKEVNIHLGENGLGDILEVYGGGLKKIKTRGSTGKDTDKGVPLLDIEKIRNAKVVLTTYESLRDYNISFAQVGFGCVIFDEVQKIKNPRSLLSGTAKTLNGKFIVGLSGTPVENSLADLWTIFDVIAPGLLNFTLKEFVKLFSGDPEELKTRKALEKLQSQLLESTQEVAAPILRRMKDEVFKDVGPDGNPMPKKIIKPADSTCAEMPSQQASEYSKYRNQVTSKQIMMIQGLHFFRKVSLSIEAAGDWLSNTTRTIEDSARLKEAFKILDKIASEKEKVLIFVEAKLVQPILATIISDRYKIPRPLIINGSIGGEKRQEFVDKFQASSCGFNAMIISPKAGGVGLTLTQANHVLHLERWWNPAVEDQCNDRAYRIGQKRNVTIYTPVARHPELGDSSYDLVLDRILTRKRLLARSLFIPTEIRPEELSEIFNTSGGFTPMSLDETYQLETGEEFEGYVAMALKDSGFKVNSTPISHDAGCDLIATFCDKTALCQIKQVQTNKVLNRGVSEIIAAASRYDAPDRLVLITNAIKITKPMEEEARKNNVTVILGTHIDKIGPELLHSM